MGQLTGSNPRLTGHFIIFKTHKRNHSFILLWLFAFTSAAAPTRINGIDVVLDPPAGFSQASAFLGFQHVQALSTIEVRELETPFNKIAVQITPEVFATQALELRKKQALQLDSRSALLFHLVAEGGAAADFNKWVLVIGDNYRSLSITAAYPSMSEQKQGSKLRDALLTTRWLRTPEQQLFYDLPFTASETENLKYTRRTRNMLVLADTSAAGELSSSSPSIVIGHLESADELTDIKGISHRQLQALNSLEIIEVTEEEEVKVDGIKAYRIAARARPKEGGSALWFEQIIAFQLYKYLLVQSSVPEDQVEDYLPQFEQVVGSIAFKQAH